MYALLTVLPASFPYLAVLLAFLSRLLILQSPLSRFVFELLHLHLHQHLTRQNQIAHLQDTTALETASRVTSTAAAAASTQVLHVTFGCTFVRT